MVVLIHSIFADLRAPLYSETMSAHGIFTEDQSRAQ